jgi:putative phosphoribosyl transferase
MALPFRDRMEAGRELASRLAEYANRQDALVLGLPRGGVPVAFAVATELHVALDVFLVRKLGVPGQEELAMGALASGGVRVLNMEVVDSLRILRQAIDAVTARELRELQRRERAYRDDLPPPVIRDFTIILVDDGLATGATMRAAAVAVRAQQPERTVIAVPVASPSICAALRAEADEVICAATPEPFYAVGLWYQDFSPTSDEEVRELLKHAPHQQPSVPH